MDASAYRMVVSTEKDFVAASAVADRLVTDWLAGKRYDTSVLDDGRNTLAPNVTLDRDADSGRHGAHTRWRLRESLGGATGSWETTLTVRAGASGTDARTWVQLDVENRPETSGRRPTTALKPRLADPLLKELQARDGLADVRPSAAVIEPDDLDEVIEELCDAKRRLPIVVASVPYNTDAEEWTERVVDRAFRQLPGMAVLYVLSNEARVAFNQEMEFHPVYGGGIRTYLPGVDPAWQSDAQRHPVMSRATLESNLGRAAGILSTLPRRLAVRSPLPPALDTLPPPRLRPRLAEHGSELARLREENQSLYTYLDESEQEREAQAREISALRHERKEAEDRVDDLTVDYDEQYAELQQARRQIRALQTHLERAGRYEEAYAPAAEDTGYPGTFAELVDRMGGFEHLVFTGDEKVTRELDDQAVSNWVEMAWDGLLALQDYAEASASGGAAGDFRAWCKNPPAGTHPFSPRKAIMKESETVRNNTRWHKERVFPVPQEVDPAGKVFMEAHLRVGSGNTVSPRLHFHDDTPRTGRVYIGYIGPHLTNTRT
ncbi:hypothetical protein GCM10010406_29810 [Streptomyces thermolineatus]|uniref:Uncharacterized protein n=1 Tax=Streptomyces thermolineatus TaxID=44033 RepID=A0ABN3LX30_9ACTN